MDSACYVTFERAKWLRADVDDYKQDGSIMGFSGYTNLL